MEVSKSFEDGGQEHRSAHSRRANEHFAHVRTPKLEALEGPWEPEKCLQFQQNIALPRQLFHQVEERTENGGLTAGDRGAECADRRWIESTDGTEPMLTRQRQCEEQSAQLCEAQSTEKFAPLERALQSKQAELLDATGKLNAEKAAYLVKSDHNRELEREIEVLRRRTASLEEHVRKQQEDLNNVHHILQMERQSKEDKLREVDRLEANVLRMEGSLAAAKGDADYKIAQLERKISYLQVKVLEEKNGKDLALRDTERMKQEINQVEKQLSAERAEVELLKSNSKDLAAKLHEKEHKFLLDLGEKENLLVKLKRLADDSMRDLNYQRRDYELKLQTLEFEKKMLERQLSAVGLQPQKPAGEPLEQPVTKQMTSNQGVGGTLPKANQVLPLMEAETSSLGDVQQGEKSSVWRRLGEHGDVRVTLQEVSRGQSPAQVVVKPDDVRTGKVADDLQAVVDTLRDRKLLTEDPHASKPAPKVFSRLNVGPNGSPTSKEVPRSIQDQTDESSLKSIRARRASNDRAMDTKFSPSRGLGGYGGNAREQPLRDVRRISPGMPGSARLGQEVRVEAAGPQDTLQVRVPQRELDQSRFVKHDSPVPRAPPSAKHRLISLSTVSSAEPAWKGTNKDDESAPSEQNGVPQDAAETTGNQDNVTNLTQKPARQVSIRQRYSPDAGVSNTGSKSPSVGAEVSPHEAAGVEARGTSTEKLEVVPQTVNERAKGKHFNASLSLPRTGSFSQSSPNTSNHASLFGQKSDASLEEPACLGDQKLPAVSIKFKSANSTIAKQGALQLTPVKVVGTSHSTEQDCRVESPRGKHQDLPPTRQRLKLEWDSSPTAASKATMESSSLMADCDQQSKLHPDLPGPTSNHMKVALCSETVRIRSVPGSKGKDNMRESSATDLVEIKAGKTGELAGISAKPGMPASTSKGHPGIIKLDDAEKDDSDGGSEIDIDILSPDSNTRRPDSATVFAPTTGKAGGDDRMDVTTKVVKQLSGMESTNRSELTATCEVESKSTLKDDEKAIIAGQGLRVGLRLDLSAAGTSKLADNESSGQVMTPGKPNGHQTEVKDVKAEPKVASSSKPAVKVWSNGSLQRELTSLSALIKGRGKRVLNGGMEGPGLVKLKKKQKTDDASPPQEFATCDVATPATMPINEVPLAVTAQVTSHQQATEPIVTSVGNREQGDVTISVPVGLHQRTNDGNGANAGGGKVVTIRKQDCSNENLDQGRQVGLAESPVSTLKFLTGIANSDDDKKKNVRASEANPEIASLTKSPGSTVKTLTGIANSDNNTRKKWQVSEVDSVKIRLTQSPGSTSTRSRRVAIIDGDKRKSWQLNYKDLKFDKAAEENQSPVVGSKRTILSRTDGPQNPSQDLREVLKKKRTTAMGKNQQTVASSGGTVYILRWLAASSATPQNIAIMGIGLVR